MSPLEFHDHLKERAKTPHQRFTEALAREGRTSRSGHCDPPPVQARQDRQPLWPPDPTPPDAGERFRVTTPHPGFAGMRAGVTFRGGVGFTADPDRAAACRALGYAAEDRGGPSPSGRK